MSSTDLTKALQEHQTSIDTIKNELRSQGLEEVNGEWVDATKALMLKKIQKMQTYNYIAKLYKPEAVINTDLSTMTTEDQMFINDFTANYEIRFKLPF